MDTISSHSSRSSHGSHRSSRSSHSHLSQESVMRVNPIYDGGIDNPGAESYNPDQDRRSSRSSSSSGSSIERPRYQPTQKKGIFGCFDRRKNNSYNDRRSSVSEDSILDRQLDQEQATTGRFISLLGFLRGTATNDIPSGPIDDTESAIPVQSQPPIKDDPDLEKKRKWLICKTVILVSFLIVCVIFFIVVLVAIKDKKYDKEPPTLEPTTEVPTFEAVTVGVSMVLARPFEYAYNDTATLQRLLLEREYKHAVEEIFSDTYLAKDLVFIDILEISADDSVDDCTFIHSKLIFSKESLIISDADTDLDTYLEMLSSALSRVTQNVEAIILADAAKPYGEIRGLDVKPVSIHISPAILEHVPVPPTTPKMTAIPTTTLDSTTKPTTTKKSTTTKRTTTAPTTTKRPTTTTKAPTTTKKPTTTPPPPPPTTKKITTKPPMTTRATTTQPKTTIATTEKPPTTTEGPCPPGIPEVHCIINPCDVSYCYLNQYAYCIPDYCGGCNANFYDKGTGVRVACWHACENGESPVQCPYNPCHGAECPLQPNAFCQANNCGGCNAEFYDLPLGGNRVVCEDPIPPEITCPQDVRVPIPPWQAGTLVTYALAQAHDNYGIKSITYSHENGTFFFEGETYVVATALDYGDNYAYCSFLVTVYFSTIVPTRPPVETRPPTMPPQTTTTEPPPSPSTTIGGPPPIDTEAPRVYCPRNIVQNNDPGEDYAIVEWTEPTAHDNIDPDVTIATDIAINSRFGLGETHVTVTATDDAGNSRTCVFTVTVVDNEPPLVLCPPTSPVPAEEGQGGAEVDLPRLTDVRATDNSRVAPEIHGYDTKQYFDIGRTTFNITATDESGNVGYCLLNIEVFDDQPPTIRCPERMTLFTFENAPLPYNVPLPNFQDNSGYTELSLLIDFVSADRYHYFSPGWHRVTYSVEDGSDNSEDCTFYIGVKVIEAIYEGQAILNRPYSSDLDDITSATHILTKTNFESGVSTIFDGSGMAGIFEGVNIIEFTASDTRTVAHFTIGFNEIPTDNNALENDTEELLLANIGSLGAIGLEGTLHTQ